jgi:hypothetical protein
MAGEAHLVFISVGGADRIPIISRVDRAMFGYFGPAEDEFGVRATDLVQFFRLLLSYRVTKYTGVVSQ